MGHYYEKFTEAIKLKCGYDLDHIIKFVLCKKREQFQLQVSNIYHVNNIYRTRCLSPMYCVNLAETSQTHMVIPPQITPKKCKTKRLQPRF